MQYGLQYHVGDCIYVRPAQNYGVLEIAQIVHIKGIPADPSISVRFFGRYDDSVSRQKHVKQGSSIMLDEVLPSGFICDGTSLILFISVVCTSAMRKHKFYLTELMVLAMSNTWLIWMPLRIGYSMLIASMSMNSATEKDYSFLWTNTP